MQVIVNRVFKGDKYTIGKLYVGGVYICDSLEPPVRTSDFVRGKTAIPSGCYSLVISYSPRFKKNLPLLKNVPNFSGVRIHIGNSVKDTKGCLLVGKNSVIGMVLESKKNLILLMNALNKLYEIEKEIYITIN